MKNMRKTFKIVLSLILAINVLLVLQSPASAQPPPEPEKYFVKEVAPMVANPGDNVFVQIRFPGDSTIIRNPADVMLVMDRTGSMSEPWGTPPNREDKIISAKKALKAFVDQTNEDSGPNSAGDYVGLVTYAATSQLNNPPRCYQPLDNRCVTLDFPIANMTDVNKVAIKDDCGAWGCGIDHFTADGNTPIGAGVDIANKELLNQIDRPGGPPSSSRAGVRKYMVLATDGEQNTAPGPCDPNFKDDRCSSVKANSAVQTAITNEIMVFTVAIGSGTGFDLLRNVACKTDTAALDPVNYCKTSQTDSDPNTNDITSPRNFFVANDPNALTDIYEEIANRISSNYWYRILDSLNPQVDLEGDPLFTGFVSTNPGPPSQVGNFSVPYVFSVTDCTNASFPNTGSPLPGGPDSQIGDLLVSGRAFTVLLRNIGAGMTVCVNFQAHINENWSGPDGSYDVDDPNQRRAAVVEPDDTCDLVNDPLECILKFRPVPNNIGVGSIVVTNPARPWLKTTGGDVGSIGRIGDIARDLTNPAATGIYSPYNADYLVISRGGIDSKFRSVKNWLVGNPSPPGYDPLNIYPPPNPTMYDTLLETYRRRCDPVTTDAGGTTGAIRDAVINSGCTILRHSGDLNISNSSWSPGAGYNGPAAVVFVEGNMTIERNMNIAANTGLIFVVRGNISIAGDPNEPSPPKRVNRVDGVFIANGSFNTYGNTGCDTTSSSLPLQINGAVYAFGQACFTRGLSNNRNNPAELINFEPKYLWLFREIAGSAPIIYREVVP